MMLKDANFLCEIGTEEIPAGYLSNGIDIIEKRFQDKLTEHKIGFERIRVYATPRRLVIAAAGLAVIQSEENVELKGPSQEAAYDKSGAPTRALQGFINGNGISEKDIEVRDTPKGKYLFAYKKVSAKQTEEILPIIIEDIVKNTPFPKKMKWGNSRLMFPRPIKYYMILFNDKIVPFELEGLKSSNLTRGHFVQSPEMIEVKHISDYVKILDANKVILDQRQRKELISAQLKKAAAELDGLLVEDDDLLDVVTFIVEYPNIVTCTFDPEFLEIPSIVLITEMKEHQKYFSVTDRNGNLLPNFFVISNNPETDFIRQGNRRVITARFNDARFFFTEDRKHKLADRVDSLKNILFHKELGSIYAKMERVQFVANKLSTELKLDKATSDKIQRAVFLSKADLNTAMVCEFTSLQGKMGKIYATLDGEAPEVAAAIEEQYSPRFQGDKLPDNMVSIILSIAEKLDNLMGSFSVGNIPKGSQDPYALRRQSAAIVELLIENSIHVDLQKILSDIAGQYKNGNDHVAAIIEFITTRMKTYLSEQGCRYDEIDACLAVQSADFYEISKRAVSLNKFRNSESDFSAMLLGLKRMSNILSAFYKKNPEYVVSFDKALLKEDSEKAMFDYFDNQKSNIEKLIKDQNYSDLFKVLINAKKFIDGFFDNVMVMDDDLRVRDNRLAMLISILAPFNQLFDFSKISE